MSRYGQHESPMDFEFQNGTGPVDARSPFAQLSQNSQRFPAGQGKKRAFNGDKSTSGGDVLMSETGTYSAFDSPAKATLSQTPSPSKPLPAVPAFNSMFTTPRKLNNDYDDSSAGETPRSPEQNNDSDATPDNTNLRSALLRSEAASMPTLPGAERTSSPTKEHDRPHPQKRESWLSSQLMRAKNKFSSPGRGEIARVDHTSGMEKRVEKRRKRDINRKESRRRRHSISDSGDDSERPNALSSPRKTSGSLHHPPQETEKKHWMSTFYTFIETHPTVPHILSWYAQLFFNIFLLSCFAYAIYSAWSAFSSDVDKKAHEAMTEIMAEMAVCAQQYTANKCDRSTRVPAMETVCENWSKCMNRDPAAVGRARVSAHTFAEIFNSFMEPISYKAMIFTFILVFGCFAISNFAFGLFRKTESVGAFPPQQYYQPPPPTPQRHFSGQNGQFYGGTPWHHQPQGLEPQASGAYGQIDGRGSPVRRIQF